jgi:hypothetical protein
VRAAAVHALLNERADWEARDTGLAAPVLFTVAGLIAVSVGAGLQVVYEESEYEVTDSSTMPIYKKDGPLNAASLITLIGGGALLGSGFALFLLRTSDGRRARELQRIDAQLQNLGVQAIMTPWISPTESGLSGGLSLRLAM